MHIVCDVPKNCVWQLTNCPQNTTPKMKLVVAVSYCDDTFLNRELRERQMELNAKKHSTLFIVEWWLYVLLLLSFCCSCFFFFTLSITCVYCNCISPQMFYLFAFCRLLLCPRDSCIGLSKAPIQKSQFTFTSKHCSFPTNTWKLLFSLCVNWNYWTQWVTMDSHNKDVFSPCGTFHHGCLVINYCFTNGGDQI